MNLQPSIAILEKQGGVLSWHEDLADGFRSQGAKVTTIQLRPTTFAEYQTKWRTHASSLTNQAIVSRISNELAKLQPDLVIVLKQAGLPLSTLDAWRSALRTDVPLIGWLCDHLTRWPEENDPCLNGVYYFDSASRPILQNAYANHTTRLQHLPLAASPLRYASANIPFYQRKRRLVFAGKNTRSRKQQIAAYRKAGGDIDTFGPLADTGLLLWRRRNLSPTCLARLYSSYYAVLNLLQSPNTLNGLNLRAFEIPAAGGLATYPLVPDLAEAFIPGEEVLAYRDLGDLKDQINELLKHPARASEIATAGRARFLREHTFAHRARRFLEDWLG